MSSMAKNGPCHILLRVDNVEIAARKDVLDNSEFFKKLLNGMDQESLPTQMHLVLQGNNATDIFEVGELLESDQLKLCSIKYMQANINIDNCLKLWKFGDANEVGSLTSKAQKFIIFNIKDVKHRKEFLELDVDQMTKLIAGEELLTIVSSNSCEMIYMAMTLWIDHLPEDRLEHKVTLLKLFDVKKFSIDFLNTVVKKDEQLRANKMAIDWFMSQICLKQTCNPNHHIAIDSIDGSEEKQLLIVDGSVDNYGFNVKTRQLFRLAPRTATPVSSAMVYRDKVYLLAGDETFSDLEYDVKGDIWNTKSFTNYKFYTGATVEDYAYLAGGSFNARPAVYKYYFETNTVVEYPQMILPRVFSSFTAYQNSIVACGGIDLNSNRHCPIPEVMDTRTGSWRLLPMTKHEYGSCTATIHANKLYVCNTFTGDTERFDFRFPRWEEMPCAPGTIGSIVSRERDLFRVHDGGIAAFCDVTCSWRDVINFEFIAPTVCRLYESR